MPPEAPHYSSSLSTDISNCLTPEDLDRIRVDLDAADARIERQLEAHAAQVIHCGRDRIRFGLAAKDLPLKKERYIIYALLIRAIIERILREKQNRPPFGLLDGKGVITQGAQFRIPYDSQRPLRQFKRDGIYQQLEYAMKITLFHEAKATLVNVGSAIRDRREDSEATPILKKAIERFIVIENFMDPDWMASQLPSLFSGGLVNTTNVMRNALEIIPSVYRRQQGHKPKKDELIHIARTSYPLLVQMAKLNFDTFMEFSLALGGSPPQEWRPGDFELAGNPLQLVLKDPEGRMPRMLREHPGMCPALVAINGHASAIRQLWDWHCDLAETIYGQVYG